MVRVYKSGRSRIYLSFVKYKSQESLTKMELSLLILRDVRNMHYLTSLGDYLKIAGLRKFTETSWRTRSSAAHILLLLIDGKKITETEKCR